MAARRSKPDGLEWLTGWTGAAAVAILHLADRIADNLRNRLSLMAANSRLMICVAGNEKGLDSLEVMRFLRRRRFLQPNVAVLGPSTSEVGRRRLRACSGVDS